MVPESCEFVVRHDALCCLSTRTSRGSSLIGCSDRRNQVEVADFIQADVVGLDAAVSGHQLDMAEVFEAYASDRAREALLDVLRESDWSSTFVSSGG
jgi:hypothetical protein